MPGAGASARYTGRAVAAALLIALASLATASGSRAAPAGYARPSAPSNLVGTSTTTTSIGVKWKASRHRAAGYVVYRDGVRAATTSTTSATVGGLSCGTKHRIGVRAVDTGGKLSAATAITMRAKACERNPAVYWGAYIEGLQTYSHLYGGAWSNGPWCDPGTHCPLPRFEQNAGKQPSIEHWGMCWTCSFDSGIAYLVVARGDIPAVDWSNGSVSDADIAAGKYDSWLKGQGQAMASFGHPMFLLFDEEMNGRWYSYSPGQNGNTAADFVAMWRHVHHVFVRNGATNVTWVWCPNVDPNHSYIPLSSIYPGDAYVDWTGLNGYNWGGGWLTFAQVFGRTYEDLRSLAPTKPIMIGEVASEETGGSKDSWIRDALSTQLPTNFRQIKAVLWFNWRIYQNGQFWDWEIESSPASERAFADSIAAPYYAAGGGFGNLPLLTKIQPLRKKP